MNAGAAAAATIKALDANSDGALDAAELAKCPPLAKALATYDSTKDGKLTVEELTDRWEKFFGPSSAFTTVSCSVFLSGRPLGGAVVKLRPIDGLSDSLSTAEGTTDENGVAHPGIPADQLPAKLAKAQLVYPGLYYVEITHPQSQIAARYNTASELGWEIDPTARVMASPRFDLKAQ